MSNEQFFMIPTMNLRFIEIEKQYNTHIDGSFLPQDTVRVGKIRVLQQLWESKLNQLQGEWRDVPLVDDSPKFLAEA